MAGPRRPLHLLPPLVLLVAAGALLLPQRGSAEEGKVSLELYYESLCPYCSRFMVNHLARIFEDGLIDAVQLRLVPYGNARVGSNSEITCQSSLELASGRWWLVVVVEAGRSMGRPPCCDKANVKKGPWTPEEDAKLLAYTSTHGTGNWTNVPQRAGLKRCGKSCRLRYTNYLRPNLKHENFTQEEEDLIVTLHAMLGSRWSLIANQLPGRTDNDVKNYWNTKLSKKLRQRGIDPITHRPIAELMHSIGALAIRPPQPPTSSPNGSTTAYLPAPALPLVDDVKYHAAGMLPPAQQQQVVIPKTEHEQQQLQWSDFLADDAAAAAAAAEAQQQIVLGQYHHHEAAAAGAGSVVAVHGAGSSSAAAAGGDVDGGVIGVGGGGGDDGAAAFIDAILDCDKETGVDQLIAELLADPAYYAGSSSSSSEMGWGMGLLNAD